MSRSRQTSRGFSLLELMIVLPIIAIAGTIALTLTMRAWQAYRLGVVQTDAQFENTTALERVSRVLRSTNQVIAASSNDLTIEAYFSPRNSVPDKARYYYANNELKVDVIPASGTAPNYTYLDTDKQTFTITNLLNTPAQPVFRYYDESGGLLTGSIDNNAVRVIEISLISNAKPELLTQNQVGSTRVQLRNMKTNL